MSERDFAAFRTASFAQRDNDFANAAATFAGDQASIDQATHSANRTHMARVVAAAAANGMSSPNAASALQGYVPYIAEAISLSDDTIFSLSGWVYDVSVSATFNADPAGTVRLIGLGNKTWATFTEAGTVTLEMPYGQYRFVAQDATDLRASCASTSY